MLRNVTLRRSGDLVTWFTYAVILLVTFGCDVTSSPLHTHRPRRQQSGVDFSAYLAQYGYVPQSNIETGALTSMEDLKQALRDFQRMANIPQTGEVDKKTLDMMKKPRCGMADKSRPSAMTSGSSGGRDAPARFSLGPSKWPKTDLTFRIDNYSPDLSQSDARRALTDALNLWSTVTPLTFREVRQDPADIIIMFAPSYHGDPYAFDGIGSTLAHAFFPGDGRGGDAHFDEDESWTVGAGPGVNLYIVAAHEFGHSLGLQHSNVDGALMYPWYPGYDPNFKLHYDDITGMQRLYGSKGVPVTMKTTTRRPVAPQPRTTPRPPRPPGGGPDTCITAVDAITMIRGQVFAFKNKWFWRMDKQGALVTQPALLSTFPAFPDIDGVDAIFERPGDGRVIIFRGAQFWEIDITSSTSDSWRPPRPLRDLGLPADITHIDAAFLWPYNRRVYLTKGSMYWRLDIAAKTVDRGYPKPMEWTWTDVPVPLDAAFSDYNENTYFFRGGYYYGFDDQAMKVSRNYPKPVAELWSHCVAYTMKSRADVTHSALHTVLVIAVAVLLAEF